MKLLITGGAGFIGTNFVYHSVAVHPGYEIVVVDKLTYAGNRANLEPLGARIQLIQADICDASQMAAAMRNADYVVHFAAESHNTRSETNPELFYRTNVEGTRTLLEAALKANVKNFVHLDRRSIWRSAGRCILQGD